MKAQGGIESRILYYHSKVIAWLLGIAAAVSFFIMLFLTADVLGRDLFNHPLQASFQLSKTLLVVIASLSFAYVQSKRANIELEFLTKHFSPFWQALLDTFAMLLGLIFFGLVFIGAFFWSIETWRTSEYMEGVTAFPYWPSRFALTIGTFAVTLTYLIQLVPQLRKIATYRKSPRGEGRKE